MKCIGLVRIGRDAELRRTTKGDAVCSFPVVYDYGRKDDAGSRPSQWVDLTLWGKRAESLVQYLVKGQQIVATISDLHIDTYEKKDGTQASKLVGSLDDLQFVGTRPVDKPREEKPRTHGEMKRAQSFADMDDDIPF